MKKNQGRRTIVIVLTLLVIIVAVGLTAAAVYARRYVGQGVETLLSQITAVSELPATEEDAQEQDEVNL